MMLSEFEKLTGLEVTTAEYEKIEAEYMESPDDKAKFCKMWLKKGGPQRLHNARLEEMLLFTLVISMGTVWRLLELLEYGEIEVRQVDTYMYFYMLATCFVAFLVGKESATIKAAKEQKMLQGSMPEQQNQTTKKQ